MGTLKIAPEYGCFPIWVLGSGGFFENIDPARLLISDTLQRHLSQFRERYDQTLNQDYPPDSGFSSEKDAFEFENSGILIWQQLLKEIGTQYEVIYYSTFENKAYTDIQQYHNAIAQKTGNDQYTRF